MSKVLKSFFPKNEQRLSVKTHENETNTEDVQSLSLDSRRKLSISRSGKMKQTTKKRYSLSPDLYGNFNTLQLPEKQTSVDYHVHSKSFTEQIQKSNVSSVENESGTKLNNPSIEVLASPEEEIDSAFEILEKPND